MRLLYFAWVREIIGRPAEELDVPAEVKTVDELVTWLRARGPEYGEAFRNDETIRTAVDKRHAPRDTAINASSEIAFFPPMTGG